MRRLSRPAVFVDRDGTLNVRPPDHEYVCSVHDFRWLAGAREGLARLAEAGYLLTVVSNQRGVSRGLVSAASLQAIEDRIQSDLAPLGCRIAMFRYCPHEPADRCSCRKPLPGMLLELARELGLDLRRSWMIGDSDSDVLAGKAAGCQAALVGAAPSASEPDFVAESLGEASHVITAT